MNKISREAARAFKEGRPYRCGNTQIEKRKDGMLVLSLHGNIIATQNAHKTQTETKITLAGWPTVTTRARLNALLDELGHPQKLSQKAGKQYLGEKEISGDEWTTL